MRFERKDDFGRQELVEIKAIGSKVCMFFARDRYTIREAFTPMECELIINALKEEKENVE